MVEVEKLTIDFGQNKIADEVSFSLKPSKIVALVGESGAGKTSIIYSLLGFCKGTISGKINVNGVDILSLNDELLRQYRGKKIGLVLQQSKLVLNPSLTIGSLIQEPMIEHNHWTKEDIKQKTSRLINRVALDDSYLLKYPRELSGGELQRVQIAIALANDPQVLVLDEALSALDTVNKLSVIRLIKEVAKGKSVVMITHDLRLACQMADEILVLHQGKIVERGCIKSVISRPQTTFTKRLVQNMPCIDQMKSLKEVMDYEEVLTYPEESKLLELREVIVSYGDRVALENISLSLYEREVISIVGESGSGKSTLARSIMGMKALVDGDVYYKGVRSGMHRSKSFRKEVQLIFQDPKSSINLSKSVLDIVTEPLRIQQKLSRNERYLRAKKFLQEVGLQSDDHILFNTPANFSGGELQRLAIARALIVEPKVIIADEATSALDMVIQSKILKLLKKIQNKFGIAMIIITHDIHLAKEVSDNIIILKNGRIIEKGSTLKVLRFPRSGYSKSLVDANRMINESKV